jgi:hypothetical protein
MLQKGVVFLGARPIFDDDLPDACLSFRGNIEKYVSLQTRHT